MKRVLSVHVPLVASLSLMLAAIFARTLGLDHNSDWGAGRWLLLGCSALLCTIALRHELRKKAVAIIPPSVRSAMIRLSQNATLRLLWNLRTSVQPWLVVLAALALYLFFATAGTWTEWPGTSQTYDDLAMAFRRGDLDLDMEPPAAFLALPDPYDPVARRSTEELRRFEDKVYDLSYYGGRFYLYWGPAPAVLLAVLKQVYEATVPDHVLTFGFLAGLLIFLAALIRGLWRDFYADVPSWLALVGIAPAALAFPTLWMLNSAGIYEATIAGGQFFLLAGLYLSFTAMRDYPSSRTRLLLATACWALAGASRTLNLAHAVFLTLMVVIWFATRGGSTRLTQKAMWPSVILLVPLTLTVIALGWYNWARFGSAFETGGRYTLTFHNLARSDAVEFSTSFVPPSLWIYSLNPIETQWRFPFLRPTIGRVPNFLHLPESSNYHTDEIAGLLYTAPFALLSLVALARTFSLARELHIRRARSTYEHTERALLWISSSLIVSVFLSLSVVLLLYDVRMRFLSEFSPSLMVLAALGLWQGYRVAEGKAASRYAYVAGVSAFAIAGIVIGVLVTFGGHNSWFQHYNPQLLKQLVRFFAR